MNYDPSSTISYWHETPLIAQHPSIASSDNHHRPTHRPQNTPSSRPHHENPDADTTAPSPAHEDPSGNPPYHNQSGRRHRSLLLRRKSPGEESVADDYYDDDDGDDDGRCCRYIITRTFSELPLERQKGKKERERE